MARFPIEHDTARVIATGPQPGAKALMEWCLQHEPTATNLGIYNPRRIRGSTRLSTHAEGRALDIGFPTTTGGTQQGWALANLLRTHHADLGIQTIIYARLIWLNTQPGWRAYTGTASHNDHIHAELTRRAAAQLTPHMITTTLGGTPMPTLNQLDSAMVSQLQTLINDHGNPPEQLTVDGDLGPKTLASAVAAVHYLKNELATQRQRATDLANQIDTLKVERDVAHQRAAGLERQLAEAHIDGAVTPDEQAQLIEYGSLIAGMRAALVRTGLTGSD